MNKGKHELIAFAKVYAPPHELAQLEKEAGEKGYKLTSPYLLYLIRLGRKTAKLQEELLNQHIKQHTKPSWNGPTYRG